MRMITMFAATALFTLSVYVIAQSQGGHSPFAAGMEQGASSAKTDVDSNKALNAGADNDAMGGSKAPAASTPAPVPTAKNTDNNATDIATGQPDFDKLIATIKASETTADKIRNLGKVTAVEIVEVTEVGGDAKTQAKARAMENAVSRYQMDLEDLRAAIVTKEELTTALDNRNKSFDDVIAAEVDDGGKVTLYARQG